ncbi:MAG TPA: hypothetical protein VNL77_14085, partial [Roseiflexaceae bacterium]|nr:hypothetical protein [Roseiflexaceae bacterium]
PPQPPQPPATGVTIKMGAPPAAAEPAVAEAEPPSAGAAPAEAQGGQQTTPDERRAAILRMVAEGRITPEEGDLLLEALG